jgi:hypothetical protein
MRPFWSFGLIIKKMYKLFLDDIRMPIDVLGYMPAHRIYNNPDWVIVKNYDEFIKTVEERGVPKVVSFDHDLADEHYGMQDNIEYDFMSEKTGYHCAKWLIDYCIDHNTDIPELVMIHSMNPAGSKNILSLFVTYRKIYPLNDD